MMKTSTVIALTVGTVVTGILGMFLYPKYDHGGHVGRYRNVHLGVARLMSNQHMLSTSIISGGPIQNLEKH
jgi:hypothetical protein